MFRQGEEVYKIAFIALHFVGGQIGMLIVLLTILCSSRVVRQATFINLCIVMMLYSLSYLLLFYTGEAMIPKPRFVSCLMQTGMVYGAPPTLSISGFIFFLHILLAVRKAVSQCCPCDFSNTIMAMMLIFPYLVYLTIFAIVVITGIRNPTLISHSTYYCDTALHGMGHAASRLSAVAVLGGVIIQIMIWLTIHRHWREFRQIGAKASSRILTLDFIIRALVFNLFCFLCLLLSISFLIPYLKNAIQNVVIAMVPFFAFLIFGSQRDLLEVWHLRRPYVSCADPQHSHGICVVEIETADFAHQS